MSQSRRVRTQKSEELSASGISQYARSIRREASVYDAVAGIVKQETEAPVF